MSQIPKKSMRLAGGGFANDDDDGRPSPQNLLNPPSFGPSFPNGTLGSFSSVRSNCGFLLLKENICIVTCDQPCRKKLTLLISLSGDIDWRFWSMPEGGNEELACDHDAEAPLLKPCKVATGPSRYATRPETRKILGRPLHTVWTFIYIWHLVRNTNSVVEGWRLKFLEGVRRETHHQIIMQSQIIVESRLCAVCKIRCVLNIFYGKFDFEYGLVMGGNALHAKHMRGTDLDVGLCRSHRLV